MFSHCSWHRLAGSSFQDGGFHRSFHYRKAFWHSLPIFLLMKWGFYATKGLKKPKAPKGAENSSCISVPAGLSSPGDPGCPGPAVPHFGCHLPCSVLSPPSSTSPNTSPHLQKTRRGLSKGLAWVSVHHQPDPCSPRLGSCQHCGCTQRPQKSRVATLVLLQAGPVSPALLLGHCSCSLGSERHQKRGFHH